MDVFGALRELGEYLGLITLLATIASFLLFYEARATDATRSDRGSGP